MVKRRVIKRIIDAIYAEFNGKCMPLTAIVERLREVGVDASYSSVRAALGMMAQDGRALKLKLHGAYTLYCIGEAREPQAFSAGNVEKCIEELAPSASLLKIAECIIGKKPRGNITGIYLAILYTLLQMVKAQKIKSFTVIADARGRPKVVVRR